MTLNELDIDSLRTRYTNMVVHYQSILKDVRFLQKKTVKHGVRQINFSDHVINLVIDKTVLLQQCQHIEKLIDCISTYKQPLLQEARKYAKLTYCPECKKKVKVKFYYKECTCVSCENTKGLMVPMYV